MSSFEQGDYPSWDLYFQIMPYEEAKSYRFNPFDLTKIWSKKDYPRIKVGTMTLNRNPENFFAQIEQAAFSPANMVPGTGNSPDKMLLGRTFSYQDAQRYRIGTNFQQLPVNKPTNEVHSYSFEGNMWHEHTGARSVYAPNSFGDSWSDEEGPVENGWEADGALDPACVRPAEDDDDFGQPGTLVREVFSNAQRDEFVTTVAGALDGVKEPVLSNAFQYWKNVDETIGQRIEDAVRANASGAAAPGMGIDARRELRGQNQLISAPRTRSRRVPGHQLARPSNVIVAGSRSRRTIVTSMTMASSSPIPASFIDCSALSEKPANTMPIDTAAVTTTGAERTRPSMTARRFASAALSPGSLFRHCSWMRLTRNTS